MRLENLHRGELIATVSGLVLALSVFLAWYSTDPRNPVSSIRGHHSHPPQAYHASAWAAQPALRFLFLLAAASPLILTYIIVRGHMLSWPRGELTAIVGITAFVLCLVAGFVVKPGDPTDSISLQYGWFVALAATVGLTAGAVRRSQESGRVRKPPGVI